MDIIRRVVVLCTGNICRSPMAEAVLRAGLSRVGSQVEVTSAGLAAVVGHAADLEAIKLMDERGLDIHAHQGTQFTGRMGLDHDLILVMENRQCELIEENWPVLQGRIYRLAHWTNSDIDDPHQRGESAFRKALTAIDAGAKRWIELITA